MNQVHREAFGTPDTFPLLNKLTEIGMALEVMRSDLEAEADGLANCAGADNTRLWGLAYMARCICADINQTISAHKGD